MSPLSYANSGLAYPSANVIVDALARVTAVSAPASGVATAPEEAPVIAFSPLKATKAPVVEFVPKSACLSC
jgi:hypothetical protein